VEDLAMRDLEISDELIDRLNAATDALEDLKLSS